MRCWQNWGTHWADEVLKIHVLLKSAASLRQSLETSPNREPMLTLTALASVGANLTSWSSLHHRARSTSTPEYLLPHDKQRPAGSLGISICLNEDVFLEETALAASGSAPLSQFRRPTPRCYRKYGYSPKTRRSWTR
jgi:hypothetical protein